MVFLEISENSQENACARVSFLIKLQASGLRPATILKKRLWHRRFPMSFMKFLKTPFRKEHLRWLLLKKSSKYDYDHDQELQPVGLLKKRCAAGIIFLGKSNCFSVFETPQGKKRFTFNRIFLRTKNGTSRRRK